MTGLMGGSAPPWAKARDFERLLSLLDRVGADKDTREYVAELHTATVAAETAISKAEGATALAEERETATSAADATAVGVRKAMAEELEREAAALDEREAAQAEQNEALAEREQAADARGAAQEPRDQELARRARLLREAGVVIPE